MENADAFFALDFFACQEFRSPYRQGKKSGDALSPSGGLTLVSLGNDRRVIDRYPDDEDRARTFDDLADICQGHYHERSPSISATAIIWRHSVP